MFAFFREIGVFIKYEACYGNGYFLKNCSFILRRTFYNAVYRCILQNMKHVKVMYVYF